MISSYHPLRLLQGRRDKIMNEATAEAKKGTASKLRPKNPTDLAVAWRLSVIMASLQHQRIVRRHNFLRKC